ELLVGYVVAEADATLDVDAVRAAAAESVPGYMVPARIVVIDELPLSVNGKLDRRRLPSVDLDVAREYRAPSTPVEEIVAAAFAAVLGVSRVGMNDNFFELGGNSLSATQVVARVNARLNTRIGIREMFESADVATFAARAESASASDTRAPLVPMERPDTVPLSLAQSRMWFLNQFDTTSPAYNVPLAIRLEGRLDLEALTLAVRDVLGRHESLRTVYPQTEDGPVQVVLPVQDVPMQLAVEDVAEEDVAARLFTFVSGGFDVTAEVPVRGVLLRITDARVTDAPSDSPAYVLGIVIHHVSSDGFSQGPLARDVMVAYTARVRGEAPSWTPLPVQYADFALWQRQVLGSLSDADSVVSAQVAYWRTRLAGLGDALPLPLDRPRPAVQSLQGKSIRFEISSELTSALTAVAQQHRATLFMAMHAAWSVLLSALSSSRDIAVGTPIAGRGEQELDDMVGMFVNTLALRVDVNPDLTFAELIESVRETDLAAFGNADVPFEQLVEALNPVRSTAYHPLFQVGFSFQNLSPVSFELPDLTVSDAGFDFDVSQFDLHLIVSESPAGGSDGGTGQIAMLTYATSLFDESTAEVFVQRFLRVLDSVAMRPNDRIAAVDVLATDERNQILLGRNDTAVPDVPELLTDMFAARVSAAPDSTALTFGDESITYGEFSERVSRLARYLVSEGVQTGDLVAVAVPRSFEMMVAMYGVVASGAGYLPIDLDHPAERTEYVLGSASPSMVIVGGTPLPTPTQIPTVDLATVDTSLFDGSPMTDAERSRALLPQDRAYVIYTSGSTGRPKGVALPHRAVANQMAWIQSEYQLTADDAMVQKTPATFDLSVWELWWPLTAGARLVLASPEGNRDPLYLARLMREQRVTVADFVPSLLGAFCSVASAQDIASLRAVLCIGEALPRDVVRAFESLSDARLDNLYGPTEAAVSVTSHRTVRGASGSVPIGEPEANVRVYVLDDRLRPVPSGVGGELYLGGVQLALGYVGRSDLTADRFVADPFGDAGSRLYRTGDAVRWTADNQLVFLDRTDTQVKIRGFRIELGEIDSILAGHESVAAAASAVSSTGGGDMLVGYVVPAGGTTVDVDAVREHASQSLPSYMVPQRIVVLDALPLSVNGKLDRRQLPSVGVDTGTSYRAPSTPVEEVIVGAFADVLSAERVGVDDNFFELGGNSLSATQVISRVNAALDARVGIREIFEAPTPAGLAVRAERAVEYGSRVPLVPRERPEQIPLALGQQRMWFLNRFDPSSPAYNIPLAIKLTGELDTVALERAIRDVLGRHESLRTVYPEGDSGPHQVVLPVDSTDLELLVTDIDDSQVKARLFEFVTRGFDVTAQVPVRAAVFRTGPSEQILAFVIHHVSADGFSLGPLARDVMVAYSSRIAGNAPIWSPLPVQFADYTLWQLEVLGHESDPTSVLSRQLEFWTRALGGIEGPIELPFDRPRPAVQSMAGESVRFSVSADTTRALTRIASASGSTLFMAMHAAFSVLLSKLSGSSDIVVGTPVAGRGEQELDELVGQFANTLGLRLQIDPDASFTDVVVAARQRDLEAFGHADIPFERVVDAIDPERSTAYHPLFQVGFSFQNLERVELTLPGLQVSDLGVDTGSAQFDLHLVVGDAEGGGGGLDCALTFSTALFDRSTAETVVERFDRVLDTVVADPSVPTRAIDVLSDAERHSVLVDVNDTAVADLPVSMVTMLDEQAARTPGGIALVFGYEVLTYGEFAARVNRFARYLLDHRVSAGDLVAVAMPRSIEMMVALHAVVATGAAYLPVTPDHPAERNAYVLRSAQPRGVLTVTGVELDLTGANTVRVDIDTVDLSEYGDGPLGDDERMVPGGEDLAYVMYTSGSTGRPKGVSVPHRAVANQLAAMTQMYGLGRDDVMIQKTAPTFDLSIWEIWWPLTAGARVVLAEPGGHRDPVYLARLTREHGVTVADFVPSLLTAFCTVAQPDDVSSLRQVLCIGEALPRSVVDAFARLGDAPVDNLYGPTEAAVSVTRFAAGDTSAWTVPIGSPEANVAVYVLDSRLRPVAPGVAGELYLAGTQLARGYFGKSPLTAERFVADPNGSGRMYRTGDAVRWVTVGEKHVLEYVSRTDDQVKVRGFRIELGEVESALTAHDSVAAAAVVVSAAGLLVGYVVAEDGATVDVDAVTRFVAGRI
ncbi:MAG: amino acid adenylation domain-containing protein, partial [Rhodococcus sp. (in: high G+C Gram-positive bacteria)]